MADNLGLAVTPSTDPRREEGGIGAGQQILNVLAKLSPNFSKVQAQRQATEQSKRQSQLQELDFKLTKVREISLQASALDEDKRDKFFESVLPDLEKFFPGSSETVKSLSKDPINLTEVINMFDNDPKVQSVAQALADLDPTGKLMLGFASDMVKFNAQQKASKKAPSSDLVDEQGNVKNEVTNTLKGLAASFFGGSINPLTGEISVLDPDKQRKLKTLVAEGEKLILKGSVKGAGIAFDKAVENLNIDQDGDFEEAPRDPSKREKDKIYKTPKGPLKWTGTGWLKP